MKALREIGLRQALRFGGYTLALAFMRLLLFPQLRVAFLRLMGARIGQASIIHEVKFFNHYRGGFGNLRVGEECFVGDDCLLDLAERIALENQVTLAERVTVLTHTNVGYADHPLQRHFPAFTQPVTFRRGCFVGASATVLPGVEIGEEAFIAAGAVVTESIPSRSVAGGVPARVIRQLDESA